LETMVHPGVEYDWDQGQLKQMAEKPPEVVQILCTNPVTSKN